MKEIWKAVAIYKGLDYSKLYEVSTFGQVRKTATKEIVKPIKLGTKGHYLYLNGIGKAKSARVHHLIYLTFKGAIKEGFVISHKDNNGFNNRLDNIYMRSRRLSMQKKNGLPVGVTRHKTSGKYITQIGFKSESKKNDIVSLGCYFKAINAGKAYKIGYKLVMSGETDKLKIKAIVSKFRSTIGLKPLITRTYKEVKPKKILNIF